MERTPAGMRHLIDWRAAVWAGVVAGLIFLLVNMALSAWVLGTPWVVPQILASLVMGPDALPPPNTFDPGVFAVALAVHLVMSVLFALLFAVVLHRWGMLVGLIGGALLGLALYGITFYAAAVVFPWFFLMRSWMMLLSHVLFGAAVGVIYEALEVDVFEPAPVR